MALDEPHEDDLTLTEQGITFAIEKDLFEKAKPITVDFHESLDGGTGFNITSSLPTGGGCCC